MESLDITSPDQVSKTEIVSCLATTDNSDGVVEATSSFRL